MISAGIYKSRKIKKPPSVNRSGERTREAHGIACPIFNYNSDVIGTVSVTIPSYRFKHQMERRILSLVKEGADLLSYLNGFKVAPYICQLKEKFSHDPWLRPILNTKQRRFTGKAKQQNK